MDWPPTRNSRLILGRSAFGLALSTFKIKSSSLCDICRLLKSSQRCSSFCKVQAQSPSRGRDGTLASIIASVAPHTTSRVELTGRRRTIMETGHKYTQRCAHIREDIWYGGHIGRPQLLVDLELLKVARHARLPECVYDQSYLLLW